MAASPEPIRCVLRGPAPAIGREINRVRKDSYMSGDEKRDLIRQLTLERNELLEKLQKEARTQREELSQ